MPTVLGELHLRIIAMRKRVGYRQVELASASGVGVKTLNTYETGTRIMSIKLIHLEALAWACGMTLGEFFADNWDDLPIMTRAELRRRAVVRIRDGYPTPQSSLSANAKLHVSLRSIR